MNVRFVRLAVCATVGFVAVAVAGNASQGKDASVYDFEMKTIDGKSAKLSAYEGNVLMIVNVASK
jgi:hypothetical protein